MAQLKGLQLRAAQQAFRQAGAPPACRVNSTHRTAGCGPARPVVWQGSPGKPGAPMPIRAICQLRRSVVPRPKRFPLLSRGWMYPLVRRRGAVRRNHRASLDVPLPATTRYPPAAPSRRRRNTMQGIWNSGQRRRSRDLTSLVSASSTRASSARGSRHHDDSVCARYLWRSLGDCRALLGAAAARVRHGKARRGRARGSPPPS